MKLKQTSQRKTTFFQYLRCLEYEEKLIQMIGVIFHVRKSSSNSMDRVWLILGISVVLVLIITTAWGTIGSLCEQFPVGLYICKHTFSHRMELCHQYTSAKIFCLKTNFLISFLHYDHCALSLQLARSDFFSITNISFFHKYLTNTVGFIKLMHKLQIY